MGRLLLIISILFLASCNDTAKVDSIQTLPENSKLVHLKLIDSLGNITFYVPIRYDTSFSWAYQSDCGKPCAEEKYRFQPKALRITKESGFFWFGEPKDSIERFTISHSSYFPFHDGDSTQIIIGNEHAKKELPKDPANPPIILDTIEKISDRYFSIIVMEKFDTAKAQFSKKVLAATTIKSNVIQFQYELLTKQNDSVTDNFIKNSINLIRTISISKGI